MSILLFVSGLALAALTLLDFFGTTLTPRRFRSLSFWTSRAVWRGIATLSDRLARPRLREAAGPATIAVLFAGWLAFTWLAWLLVFLADSQAVIETGTGRPATVWERAYFVGHTLSTLGIGDYVAGGDLWRMLTAIASFAGLTIITLTIATLFWVFTSISEARALAAAITSLGPTGADMLIRGFDGAGFDPLLRRLAPLGDRLLLHGERAEASPIINPVVDFDRRRAIGPAIATLDDALMLLRHAVAPEARPHALDLEPLLAAIESMIPPGVSHGKPPSLSPETLARLRAAGIPLAPAPAPPADDARDRRRRTALAGWLREAGWVWEPDPRPLGRRDLRPAG